MALNEHCAVLRYQYQDTARPAQSRSFLIDAGAQFYGYASDITRTWSAGLDGSGEFDALLAAMEAVQLALVDEVRAGVDYRYIHLSTHRRIAAILASQGIVKMSAEAIVAEGIRATVLPTASTICWACRCTTSAASWPTKASPRATPICACPAVSRPAWW